MILFFYHLCGSVYSFCTWLIFIKTWTELQLEWELEYDGFLPFAVHFIGTCQLDKRISLRSRGNADKALGWARVQTSRSHASEHFRLSFLSPRPSTTNVRPMSSIYFPTHVVAIIRRLLNVVSTLSISNQYFLHRQTLAKPDELSISNNLNGTSPLQPLDCLKNVEWPWWAVRRNWDMGLCKIDTGREIRNSGMVLKCESARKKCPK
jgi:hypothetical protein